MQQKNSVILYFTVQFIAEVWKQTDIWGIPIHIYNTE